VTKEIDEVQKAFPIHFRLEITAVPVFSRVRAINAGKIASIRDVAAAFGESIFFCQINPICFHALAFQVIGHFLPQFICGNILVMDRSTRNARARQFPGQEAPSQLLISQIRKNIYAFIVLPCLEIIGVDIAKLSLYCSAAARDDPAPGVELDGSPWFDAVLGSL
jgi:hypothetical protein